jgi:NAD(P)-dependent dehydrogenase (short-subunit alcohol dehydrogenase family)
LAGASDDKLQILALYVTDPMSVQAAAAELNRQAIDLLLNNAGIGGPRGQTVGNIDYEAWAKVLDVNTMGPLRVSEAFVDHEARSERKLIVTLTSGMGSIADNTSGGSIAYRSSKAAVNMVMRSLAIDLGQVFQLWQRIRLVRLTSGARLAARSRRSVCRFAVIVLS